MSKIYTRVSRVADWAGWCSPCGSEDRPLVLTRSGPGGVHSWLSGLSDDDRILLLTCRVCGEWQLVPAREEEDPEIVLEEDEEVTPEVREVVAAVVAEALPEPRRAVERIVTVPESEAVTIPAFSPEAVAAAAQVLAAARATLAVPAPRAAERSRRSGSGPTPRRAQTPATAPALPEVLGLPTGTRQLVLAAAR